MISTSARKHLASCPCFACPKFVSGTPGCAACPKDVVGAYCLSCSRARRSLCTKGWEHCKSLRSGQLPLKQRIVAAFGDRRTMKYHDLLDAVFPQDLYPKSRNYSSNGGPPGCCMTLGRALRELGIRDGGGGLGSRREVTLPSYLVAAARGV